MSSIMAPNVSGVNAPGKRTVYSMCGMCSVRCPIEVTVEDGRVVWLQGNTHDLAIGASLCAKGSAGLALEYDDDQRPQTPLIRMGPRGAGQWRRASWDEALDYIADKLQETIHEFGGRGIVLSDRSGPFTDLTRTFIRALGSPNYVTHDAVCIANVHNAARHALRLQPRAAHPRPGAREAPGPLRPQRHRGAGGQGGQGLHGRAGRGIRVTYIDPRATFTACKATRYWQVRPNSDYTLNLAIIHELLKLEAYDKDFVARFVSGMDYLAEAVKDTTPEWQEQHTGVPAEQLRAFVKEIAADAPHVVFNPGWGTARHKQSFYVSRTALILNVLMGNLEIPGGFILAKPPEYYGRKGLKHLIDRVPPVDEPARRRRWDHQAAVGSQDRHVASGVRRHGDGAALRHRRLLRLPPRSHHRPPRYRGGETRAG